MAPHARAQRLATVDDLRRLVGRHAAAVPQIAVVLAQIVQVPRHQHLISGLGLSPSGGIASEDPTQPGL